MFYRFRLFPYISLLLWILPLLLFSSGENSLMAHDEGLYARRSRVMFESGDWIAPWGTVHHKTPGPYWIIAISYQLFGISEASVRLPSMILGILSIFLIYEIGKILLNQKLAWLAGLILTVQFLWLQYCRLGTPDVPMIFLVLLGILSVLKAELHPKYSYFWTFIAGLSFGLGFLVRSFMIFLPIVALLPYLIGEHRRHRHLTNPCLYLGFVVGLIPTSVWLWLNWMRYGNDSYEELFRFVFQLGSNERGGNGMIFYLWNVPLKAFPWFFLSLLGLVLLLRRPIPRYQLILVGFPVTLFAELSFFSTRLSHYSLCLYPFIAMLAAVGLSWLGKWGEGEIKKLPRNLSYAFGGLGILLVLAGIVILIGVDGVEVRKYAILGLIMGCGWLILPMVWIGREKFEQKFLTAGYWWAGWLIPCWLGLAVAGNLGLLSDYNPDVRVFLQQPAIASIVQHHPIYFLQTEGKTAVLLNFYTPIHGEQVDSITELPASSYAWISANHAAELTTPHQVIGTVQKHQLIQVFPQRDNDQ
ncbi:ArnT family glycosyltransferase [Nodularia sphaerocarpa]|uniref:ArnT family glycosyltransferase n=1 Tax=Nodularia sphaerocarpa TaxID=137816 RepID=UPI001EFA86CE|nr:glycosyltransferase family 39 protein [Nodularia sphaerocarpa]MDB9375130.1 glycosyltransferase family 39 protein [Nodularia sphaerocarpa CS-585]